MAAATAVAAATTITTNIESPIFGVDIYTHVFHVYFIKNTPQYVIEMQLLRLFDKCQNRQR